MIVDEYEVIDSVHIGWFTDVNPVEMTLNGNHTAFSC